MNSVEESRGKPAPTFRVWFVVAGLSRDFNFTGFRRGRIARVEFRLDGRVGRALWR